MLNLTVCSPLSSPFPPAHCDHSLWQVSHVDIVTQSEKLTCMCRLLFFAIAPSCPSKAPVQDKANRGVTTGFTRGYYTNETDRIISLGGFGKFISFALLPEKCNKYLFVEQRRNEPLKKQS